MDYEALEYCPVKCSHTYIHNKGLSIINIWVKGIAKIERLRLKIIGVSCATCIVPIRKKLEKENGVSYVGSNYITELILVDYDPKIISKMDIIQLIKNTGYNTIQMH
jgi:copper chaperone CopZ